MNYSAWADRIVPLIHLTGGICLCLYIMAIVVSKIISGKLKQSTEHTFKKSLYYLLDIPYTVFIAIVSIFPLLGMLGTVLALMSLDVSGATDALKNNFFQALDTTMWGIIYAAVFKFANAFVQSYVEAQIEKAKFLMKRTYSVSDR